jgi:4-diphosphocytidyl-2-C-methyl-D-erythritol kinase
METYQAYAKINLSLEILGRRADGYHEIVSVMQTVSLADTLTVEAAPPGELTVACDLPELDANPQGNLVWRAARILQQARHVPHGARLTLTKRIPLAAGLGGGSSDAAVTLHGLNRLWNLELTGAELLNAARLLGADVPFFLRGGTALIEGKGDRVTELRALAPCWIVLITPEMVVPEKTKTLYAALRVHERTNGVLTKHLVNAIAAGEAPPPALLYNGFEDPAFRLFDGLAELQETITEAGGDAARLSGSGPSMFVLYPTQEEAMALLARLLELDIPAQVVTPVAPIYP